MVVREYPICFKNTPQYHKNLRKLCYYLLGLTTPVKQKQRLIYGSLPSVMCCTGDTFEDADDTGMTGSKVAGDGRVGLVMGGAGTAGGPVGFIC